MVSLVDQDTASKLDFQLNMLQSKAFTNQASDIACAPLFTAAVLQDTEAGEGEEDEEKEDEKKATNKHGYPITQYGLIGGLAEVLDEQQLEQPTESVASLDPRVFFNVAAPTSTFICGSQGSGKSHTLSCLLENCLVPSNAGSLPNPLTGILFHYDAFISDDGGSPCEAAFLSSNPNVKVRVLCAPSNIETIKRTYHALNVTVETLKIDQTDLNTKRMLDLMAFDQDDGQVPLYVHVITRILRDMRIQQQNSGEKFSYKEFKLLVNDAGLTPFQLSPLGQRLDTLESFMNLSSIGMEKQKKSPLRKGTDWSAKPGHLTIVDLSCPCVTPAIACSLFNITLSIFLEQSMDVGRLVALDEAHKFMDKSAEASNFTKTLLSTIRLQRHLGTRIFISTQEPTISPALLDLSSATVVHRFTSPEWLRSLRTHLAAATTGVSGESSEEWEDGSIFYNSVLAVTKERDIFRQIVQLGVGEALVFSPSAVLDVGRSKGNSRVLKLGGNYFRMCVRSRLTTDGGQSVMAN